MEGGVLITAGACEQLVIAMVGLVGAGMEVVVGIGQMSAHFPSARWRHW